MKQALPVLKLVFWSWVMLAGIFVGIIFLLFSIWPDLDGRDPDAGLDPVQVIFFLALSIIPFSLAVYAMKQCGRAVARHNQSGQSDDSSEAADRRAQ